MKLVALYDRPEDPQAFEEAYFDTHIPLLEKVPGLQRTEILRFTNTVMGQGKYMMAVMHFEGQAALDEAMRSSEMRAAGENLNGFAKGLVSLMYAQEERS